MKHGYNRLPHVLFTAATIFAAPAAVAQKVGHYQGTNNEGGEVDIDVANVSGALVISYVGDAGTVHCGGAAFGYGVGFSGFNTPITAGAATFDDLGTTVYFDGTFTFKGKNSVSGAMRFGVPLYTGTAEPPKKASSCLTKPQTYSADYVGTDARAGGPKRAVTWPLAIKK